MTDRADDEQKEKEAIVNGQQILILIEDVGNGQQSGQKSPLSRGSSSFWLRRLFRALGRLISLYPLFFVALGITLSLCSVAMVRLELRDNIREGYTPDNAPFWAETDAMRAFWNSTDEPLTTILLVQARTEDKGGNLLHLAHLREVVQLQEHLVSEFSCVDKAGRQFRFAQLCGDLCLAMKKPLEIYVERLDNAVENLREDKEWRHSGENFSYPFPYLKYYFGPITIRLDHIFFGVTQLASGGGSESGKTDKMELSPEQRITGMASVRLLLLAFRPSGGGGPLTAADRNDRLSKWQIAVAEYFEGERREYFSDQLSVQVVGTEILNREMLREGQRTVPFFGAGFCLMFLFVSANVLFGGGRTSGGRRRAAANAVQRLCIAASIILCPLLAVATTFGLLTVAGERINSFLLVLPFLVLGIGVDDGFLLIHKWERTHHIGDPVQRLPFVLSEVGPSITITTLTNVISFAIGAFNPTPEVRLFCRGASIALAVVYLLNLFILCPVLQWTAIFDDQCPAGEDGEGADGVGKEATVSFVSHPSPPGNPLFRHYCLLLSKVHFAFLLAFLLVIYWTFSLLGVLYIKPNLNTTKIIPRHSHLQSSTALLDNLVWGSHFAVTVLVQSQLNMSDQEQLGRLWHAIEQFEQVPSCKGKEFTLIWLRDYQKYFYHYNNLTKPLDNCFLNKFFAEITYKHWKSFVRLGQGNICPNVDQFTFVVAYQGKRTWDLRIELVQQLRGIASDNARKKDLQMVVWEQNGMFVDQMVALKPSAIEMSLLSIVSMTIVCVFFMPNPFSLLMAVISIASISVGVFGLFYWCGFDLDPVAMAALLMSIGLSVDFCSHAIYHFQYDYREVYNEAGDLIQIPLVTKVDRIEHALGTIAKPMLQSGISTVLSICPIIFIQSYAGNIFICSILLVCSLGIAHGILLLPTLLALLPNRCTNVR